MPICPNCGHTKPYVGQPNKPCKDKPGKQYNPFSTNIDTNPVYVQPGQRIAQSEVQERRKKDKIPSLKDFYVSDDIKQCPKAVKKRKKSLIFDKIEVMKSCDDLEIDG